MLDNQSTDRTADHPANRTECTYRTKIIAAGFTRFQCPGILHRQRGTKHTANQGYENQMQKEIALCHLIHHQRGKDKYDQTEVKELLIRFILIA